MHRIFSTFFDIYGRGILFLTILALCLGCLILGIYHIATRPHPVIIEKKIATPTPSPTPKPETITHIRIMSDSKLDHVDSMDGYVVRNVGQGKTFIIQDVVGGYAICSIDAHKSESWQDSFLNDASFYPGEYVTVAGKFDDDEISEIHHCRAHKNTSPHTRAFASFIYDIYTVKSFEKLRSTFSDNQDQFIQNGYPIEFVGKNVRNALYGQRIGTPTFALSCATRNLLANKGTSPYVLIGDVYKVDMLSGIILKNCYSLPRPVSSYTGTYDIQAGRYFDQLVQPGIQ